ncbi:MAG: hydroxymethylbilane synthase [SAR202 cluster bacterium]|nr:hydroxymethylbilane synthase [SAR202 cluster bacterium]
MTLLTHHDPNLDIEIIPVSTTGDQDRDSPLQALGRGAFVKEIEHALLNHKIDIAVHSAKDLAPDNTDNLSLVTAGEREDPRDVLVSSDGSNLSELMPGARLGTSSLRRLVQVKELRPDLIVQPIRGNVGTRLQKVQGPDYDAVILAAAGLKRLGQLDVVSEFFDPSKFTSDVGQGTLVVQHRSADSQLGSSLASITHAATSAAFRAERTFLAAIGGGCSSPVAAYAHIDGDHLRMSAMAGLPDGSQVFRTTCEGNFSSPETAGQLLGNKLLSTGAKEFLGG